MRSSLLVIGAGIWGNKISDLFQKWDFNVIHYGARDYLNLSFKGKQMATVTDLVWIASIPDLQIRIMKEIKKLEIKSMIILEKPFFRNFKEHEEFNEIIKTRDLIIRASSPWVYSDIWLKAKDIILQLDDPLSIKITRSGPFKRSKIQSYLDWLSHDVQLISDLFTLDTRIIDLQSKFKVYESGIKKFILKFNNGSLLEMNGGSTDTRISSWEVQDSRGYVLNVSFVSKSLELFSNKKDLVYSYESPKNDEPLLNMIQQYCHKLNNTKNDRDFRWQEVLIQ
jgi:predicted dehydrogenase